MKARLEAFSTHKLGGTPLQNEDAFSPVVGLYSPEHIRVNIVDGASEGFLSRIWSGYLADRLAPPRTLKLSWPNVTKNWVSRKQEFLRQREADGLPLQWYEEPGMHKAAFATLLTARFFVRPNRSTSARMTLRSIGDCCVFRFSSAGGYRQFPILKAEDFTTAPELVFSDDNYDVLTKKSKREVWDIQVGDTLFFATDALSHWIVSRLEDGELPWNTLLGFSTEQPQEFVQWVDGMKSNDKMKDDDVTLVRIQFLHDPPPAVPEGRRWGDENSILRWFQCLLTPRFGGGVGSFPSRT